MLRERIVSDLLLALRFTSRSGSALILLLGCWLRLLKWRGLLTLNKVLSSFHGKLFLLLGSEIYDSQLLLFDVVFIVAQVQLVAQFAQVTVDF